MYPRLKKLKFILTFLVFWRSYSESGLMDTSEDFTKIANSRSQYQGYLTR